MKKFYRKKSIYLVLVFVLVLCGCKVGVGSNENLPKSIVAENKNPSEGNWEIADNGSEWDVSDFSNEMEDKPIINSSINEENLFASIPEEYLFSYPQVYRYLKIAQDGTFIGEYWYYDKWSLAEEDHTSTEYVCEFTGKFSNPSKVGGNIYEVTVESMEWDHNHPEKTEEFENGEKRRTIYREPDFMSEGDKMEFYVPGAYLDELNKGFVNDWTEDINKRKTLPKGYFGIVNVSDVNNYSLRGTSEDFSFLAAYEGETEKTKISFKKYVSEVQLEILLKDENNKYRVIGDVYEDNQTDFIAGNSDGSCHIDIEYLDDKKERIKLVLRSDNGSNLSSWGGTDTGELVVELDFMYEIKNQISRSF